MGRDRPLLITAVPILPRRIRGKRSRKRRNGKKQAVQVTAIPIVQERPEAVKQEAEPPDPEIMEAMRANRKTGRRRARQYKKTCRFPKSRRFPKAPLFRKAPPGKARKPGAWLFIQERQLL